jgi:pyruvate kinase
MAKKKTEQLAMLLSDVVALRDEVGAGGMSLYRAWRGRIDRPDFAASALNFAHYLVLRRLDLRRFQRRLMVLGLSSLGRSEGRVLTTLDAIGWALAQMTGQHSRRGPSDRQFFRGQRQLRLNTAELFGPPREGRAGRIMVTLGKEAAEDASFVANLAAQGADVVRINCGHDSPDVWRRMIENTRAAGRLRPLRVLMDIAGPKVRMEQVVTPPDRSHLQIGDQILLCRDIIVGGTDFPFRSTCTPRGILDRLKVGDVVSIDDGKLRGSIVARAEGGFTVSVTEGRPKGVKLKPGRGINFPAVDLNLDPLTEKDRRDLDFVALHADLVGHSFVQNANHVTVLQRELAARRSDWRRLGLVAKVETPAAVSNLPEIIVQAAGQQPLAVMIARGDLAVELGFERLAEVQEEILWLCEAAQVPAIWATQVLEGLIQEGLPSRGEMTDAAKAGQAECVMLNKGPNLAAGVGALDRLLKRMGEDQVKKTPTLRALHSWPKTASPDASRLF